MFLPARMRNVADKLTQQIVESLSLAAASPAGTPLFASKSEPGLFPGPAKAAAQKCLTDRLIHIVRSEPKGKLPRELYGLTEAGWDFLLAAVNPKQVLEDFVRVLEQRQGEVSELLDTARHMAGSLQGLKDAVARVLPQVSANRIAAPEPMKLTDTILDQLVLWSASAGEDCSLAVLFRRLQPRPTHGEFHDALRSLHAAGSIYLHPWTGPLSELPDPACALLVGHGVAFYASCRNAGIAKPRVASREEVLA
jgi:hypothetical protein